MQIEIDQKIFDICKSHIRFFKNECLTEDYDYFKNKNQDDWNIMYLQSCLLDPKNMKKLKNKLLNGGIESNYINNLFYIILKYNYKYDVGNFSWFEIQEWDIEPELVKKTSTKYTLI
tara:strand:- start:778 stop:1128 length:351 start_codon:yes stop_codon:yes gene_type:complete